MSARGDQDQETKRWFVGDQNEIIVSRVEELARQQGLCKELGRDGLVVAEGILSKLLDLTGFKELRRRSSPWKLN
jgi:hypothetical protein